MRGGGYLLLRYLFDRTGGDALDAAGLPVDQGGLAWLKSFIATQEIGVQSLEQSTQLGLPQIAEQFWTALVLSNRGPDGVPLGTDPRLAFRPTTTDPLTGRQRGCRH